MGIFQSDLFPCETINSDLVKVDITMVIYFCLGNINEVFHIASLLRPGSGNHKLQP